MRKISRVETKISRIFARRYKTSLRIRCAANVKFMEIDHAPINTIIIPEYAYRAALILIPVICNI